MKRLKKLERRYIGVMKSLRNTRLKQLKQFKTKSSNFRYHIKSEIKRKK